MAKVQSGANSTTANIVGRTITDIRNTHGQSLGIDSGSVAYLNGRTVESHYVVRETDHIEFVKTRGQKG